MGRFFCSPAELAEREIVFPRIKFIIIIQNYAFFILDIP
ncbi:hypothetical protein NBRC3257_2494 [Gluconobacter thailandicus NBRC 3257]|uniref:Transposase n=1 Tax=Gluconobacter thailandicus NBRC 3257 TaxID=1381097 RepID=A0ABQ0IZ63_GLUTH|nr:hypothetical protein NBRC3255_0648 [Gluconobacter thailandicus NBRC 3255]GAD27495.1 hypothetical protein NBRC3257_2494 [Gluconobacter thailandicus NBRC 3257]